MIPAHQKIQDHHQVHQSTRIPVIQLVQVVSVVREEVADLLIVPLAQDRILMEVVLVFLMYQDLPQVHHRAQGQVHHRAQAEVVVKRCVVLCTFSVPYKDYTVSCPMFLVAL
jgi:hypothetical protein|tara:strand:- start:2490 stop:2825 length:336 start_codon:yes stop_codon:yes gene_type:complete